MTSLLEMRQEHVVIQEWDISCGAAALATVLTYQHGDPVPERDIAQALIKREEYLTNPTLVRVQQGFSLLDLQRYVDGRGYEGVPLGMMTYQDLLELAPMIVPISTYGYNHFVVFRGAFGNRVLLADPSFGNRTLAIETFQDAWIEYPEFGHVGFLVKRRDGLPPPNQLAPKRSDFVTLG
ncbi:MAG: C39 family peptidase [Geminicoccaceae bacterium]